MDQPPRADLPDLPDLPAPASDLAARVDRLLQDLRTVDSTQVGRVVAEVDELLESCRLQDGPTAATTMRLEIARSAVATRRADVVRSLERLRPLMALALDVHGTDGMPVLEGRWNGVLLLRRVRRRGDAVREADCLARTLMRTHGPDHADVVAARVLLAETLGAAGLHVESLRLFSQLATEVCRRCGPGSTEVLVTYMGWADALYMAGRRAEAVVLMRQVNESAEATLAQDHPTRRSIKHHLSRLEGVRPVDFRRAERRLGRNSVHAASASAPGWASRSSRP